MIRKNIEFGNLKDVTVLEFGKGDIQVQPAVGEDYTAVLYKTDQPHDIGTEHDTIGKNSDWFKTEIAMTFTNADSIDVVIKKLTEAKSYLSQPTPVNNLPIYSVINWVALKDNIKPENDTDVLVKFKDGKVRQALFSGTDYRFYNPVNEQDISDLIEFYASMPK